MAHREHRDEVKWKDFEFNQPYAKGLDLTMWQATDEEREHGALLTEKLERKALRVVQED